MVLRVPFDEFVSTVRRRLECAEAYLYSQGPVVLVTAGDATKGLIVAASAHQSAGRARSKLEKEGLTVFEGAFGDGFEDAFAPMASEATIVAVAYKSRETTPGVWVDAFPDPPTRTMAIRALYDEFRETGEIEEISFEEFVRLAEPNAVLVAPEEVQSFLREKALAPDEPEGECEVSS
jgi:hypothetical protein